MSAESVDSALWDIRSLVIHRAMRGRLYAMRRDILPVAHAATKRQVIRYAHEFAEARGIDVRTYEVAADEIADVLAAAGPLSLRGIRARVGVRSDLGAVVGLMCAEGRILRSSPEDGRFGRRWRFDLAERVVPGLHLGGMDERLAARTLLVAYVRAFGPVTLRDAAWWTGRAPLHVKRSIALLEDEIVPVMLDHDQEEYYMHGADVEELERAAILDRPSVALLPSMDPLLTGYADRSRFVDDELRTRVFDRSADVAPVVVVNGRVAGVWDTLAGDRPVVAVHWFSEPDDSTRAAFVSAAERQGRILFGESPLIVRVRRMPPVFGRAGSAAAHPLRGIAEGTEEVPTA